MPISFSPYAVTLKGETTIFQNQIKCEVNENEYNYSQNPTVKKNTNGDIKDNLLIDEFTPYVTTIGIYNERNELLIVGKFMHPIPMPKNNDITFILRYDS